jgi:hypothetical protein
MVKNPKEYAWGNYEATAGFEPESDCLETDWLLGGFTSNVKWPRGHIEKM